MKKNDFVFFILSLILNILFLFIASFIINKRNIKEIKITVGLIQLEKTEDSKKTKVPLDENKPTIEKVEEKKEEPKKVEPKKEEPIKVEPKKVEPKKEEPIKVEPKKAEPKKEEPIKVEPKKVEPKKEEPIKVEPKKVEPKKEEPIKVEPKKVEPKKEEPKKEEPKKIEPDSLTKVEEILEDPSPNEPVEVVVERKKPTLEELKSSINRPTLNENFDLNINDSSKYSKKTNKIKTFDMKSQKDISSKGYSIGSDDDKTVIIWDKNNKEPLFPESAKLTGKDGYVTMNIKVNRNGDILSFVMEKGSGVPEINEAILRVVGTWKMKIASDGFIEEGEFKLNYYFVLDE